MNEERVVMGGPKGNCTVSCRVTLALLIGISTAAFADGTAFNYEQDLVGAASTLGFQISGIDFQSGTVTVNGGDTRQLASAFTWKWGDGITTDGFFPQQHTYGNLTVNYIIEVIAHYADGGTGTAKTVVFFVSPLVNSVRCPPELLVTIPDHEVTMGTHFDYSLPTGMTFFDASAFPVVPRTITEYLLTVGAMLQMDYANHDVFLPNGAFNQILLRSVSGEGMGSMWYTTPVSFCAGDYAFGINQSEYSSFFHEIGHNVSLNSPAAYFYGGKSDGNANAIFSESMAQIFQHATAYDILNHTDNYGLDVTLTTLIAQSAHSSMRNVRNAYNNYVNGGMHFVSWNNPVTPDDETLNTFMTIAYVFCSTAEQAGTGYRAPLKRMMELLQLFNPDIRQRYDQNHNTQEADAFRATLMVTAMSHGFGRDLRQQFRNLAFPIDDAVYAELSQMVKDQKDTDRDGLTNVSEELLGTSPTNSDTDGDGVSDGVELSLNTAPLDADSPPHAPGETGVPAVALYGSAVLCAFLIFVGGVSARCRRKR